LSPFVSGTVTPLVLFPGDMFVREPFVLTLEAQYIIKNLVLVSGALVVGATVRGGTLRSEPIDRGARARARDAQAIHGQVLGVSGLRGSSEATTDAWVAEDAWVAGKGLITIGRCA
jgi:hypothetical protein